MKTTLASSSGDNPCRLDASRIQPENSVAVDRGIVAKGDWVVAVGNCFNIAGSAPDPLSANMGIVAATVVCLVWAMALLSGVDLKPGLTMLYNAPEPLRQQVQALKAERDQLLRIDECVEIPQQDLAANHAHVADHPVPVWNPGLVLSHIGKRRKVWSRDSPFGDLQFFFDRSHVVLAKGQNKGPSIIDTYIGCLFQIGSGDIAAPFNHQIDMPLKQHRQGMVVKEDIHEFPVFACQPVPGRLWD